MVTKEICLKLWENNYLTLLANQGEVNSRYVVVYFQDEFENNLNLSGKSVTFYALKPDGTQIFNNCTVDTANNTATVMLTSQMSSIVGILECEFQIFDSNNTLLKANGIKIIVSSKGDFSEAVESKSEFNTLVQAINTANTFSSSVGDISELTTTANNTLVDAINELDSKVIPISQGGTGSTTASKARESLEVRKEHSLYSNSSGTYGTITLSDSYTNYDLIRVYFLDNGVTNVTEFPTNIGKQVNLDNVYIHSNGTVLYIHSCLLTFSGTSATFSRNNVLSLTTSNSVNINQTAGNGIYVNKIVGYKY